MFKFVDGLADPTSTDAARAQLEEAYIGTGLIDPTQITRINDPGSSDRGIDDDSIQVLFDSYCQRGVLDREPIITVGITINKDTEELCTFLAATLLKPQSITRYVSAFNGPLGFYSGNHRIEAYKLLIAKIAVNLRHTRQLIHSMTQNTNNASEDKILKQLHTSAQKLTTWEHQLRNIKIEIYDRGTFQTCDHPHPLTWPLISPDQTREQHVAHHQRHLTRTPSHACGNDPEGAFKDAQARPLPPGVGNVERKAASSHHPLRPPATLPPCETQVSRTPGRFHS